MVSSKYRAFSPDKVKLLPSIFQHRSELNQDYVASLKVRNLMQDFYLEAGITEHRDKPEDAHWGWESPTCQLRGHFLGHWLYAAARIYAQTADPLFKGLADKVVSELARCQKENGGEWAGSIPEKYLDWIARGKSVWAPQYTLHKTLMGLIESVKLTQNEQALEVLEKWARWFHRWTGQFSREQMDNVLDFETGGMLEVWADLYGITGKEEHLDLIKKYDRPRLFDRLLAGEDPLTNRHANTTIPEIMGAARAYEVTGEKRYRDIAEAYWKCAVPDRGCYATGGQTCGEVWGPPHDLSARLADNTQEHCVVYNMMRLADYFIRWTGELTLADYQERNLYNGILAQQNPHTGMVAYYLPMRAGGVKGWGTPTNDFWCCHGSLVQAHAHHNSSVYFEDDDGLLVAQYIPTELSWERGGVPIKVTQTFDMQRDKVSRPTSHAFNLAIECEKPVEFALKIRLPWWLAGEAQVTVNGDKVPVKSRPSSCAVIKRKWNSDKVHVELPRKLASEPLPGEPDTVAFMEGPIVLAGLCDEEWALVGDKNHPESMLTPDADRAWGVWTPRYRAHSQDRGLRFVPLFNVVDERYTIYFPIKPGGK